MGIALVVGMRISIGFLNDRQSPWSAWLVFVSLRICCAKGMPRCSWHTRLDRYLFLSDFCLLTLYLASCAQVTENIL